MKRKALVWIAVVFCVILGSFIFYLNFPFHSASPAQSASEESRQAPHFELFDFENKKRNLLEFQGKLIILHFWASWCPPCLDEIPHWVELGTAFKNEPVVFIAISLDQHPEEAIKILPVKNLTSNVISLIDPHSKVSDQYGSYQFPETYLISPNLKIITKLVGPQDWTSPVIHRLIWMELNRWGLSQKN